MLSSRSQRGSHATCTTETEAKVPADWMYRDDKNSKTVGIAAGISHSWSR
jgi:hypothetical protein